MSNPLVHALIAHFDSAFAGPNGDYAAVLEVVRGLTAAQAGWKPEPESNSIWQILEHLIASKAWQIEMLERGQAAAPVWIEPSGGEAAWQEALGRLEDSHRRLKQALEKLTDADLLAVPDPAGGQTLLELLLSSGPAHEAHHGGQMDYLRGLHSRTAKG